MAKTSNFINGILQKLSPAEQQILRNELNKSDETFQKFFEQNLSLNLIADFDGRIIRINNNWENVLGYDLKELQGKLFIDFVHEDDKKATIEEVAKLSNEIETNYFVNRYLHKNGNYIHLAWSAVPSLKEKTIYAMAFDISESVKTEQNLYKEEERRKILIDQSRDGIVVLNNKGGVVEANKKFAEMIGYTPEEVKNLFVCDWEYATEKEIIVEMISSVDSSGDHFETAHIRKDRSIYDVQISTNAAIINGEKQIFCVCRDISENKRHQSKIKQSEERYKNFINQVTDGVYRFEADVPIPLNLGVEEQIDFFYEHMFIAECNSAFMKMYGIEDPKEIIGKYQIELHGGSDNPVNREALRTFIENGYRITNLITEEIDSNGNKIYFNNNSIGIIENNHLIRSWGTQQDLTERINYEKKLAKEHELLDSIINNIPVFISRYYPDLKLVLVNKELETVSGWTKEDFCKLNFYDLVYPDLEEREKAVEHMKNANGQWKELKSVTKNGETIPILWSNIKLKDGTLVGIGLDLRDRIRSEQALIKSQRLSAMGEMASGIAHDFNNALQAISGNIELALFMKNLPDKLQKYLTTIKMITTDSAARVQLLQRFGGTKHITRNHSIISTKELVEDVLMQTRPLWKNQSEKVGIKIDIITKLDDKLKILGNDGELRSVLFNVIKNSTEAMPAGGEIKIETSLGNGLVKMIFADSGIGMDEDTKGKIFQPFFSTKGFEAGRGFGMSSAYAIITEHGGTIEVLQSEPNKGTTIKIEIPTAEFEASTNEIVDKKVDVKKSVTKILWVEDEIEIREIISETFEALGIENKVVSSGKEALFFLKSENYSLVVTDIGLPDMNGWDLIKNIRKTYGNKIDIVIATGWGDQIGDKEISELNIKLILTKPFKLKQIRELIENGL